MTELINQGMLSKEAPGSYWAPTGCFGRDDLEIVAGASYGKALQQFAISLPKIKTP